MPPDMVRFELANHNTWSSHAERLDTSATGPSFDALGDQKSPAETMIECLRTCFDLLHLTCNHQ